MDDHSGPRWRIGQVSARTGLTTRTLRYYDELGLLNPSERLADGHRVYASEDLRRLYRVSLLRQLGLPLSDIGRELDDSSRDLTDTIDRHIGQLDQRNGGARSSSRTHDHRPGLFGRWQSYR